MTIGQRIKEARKKAGLTQKELGAKLGIAYQTLAQWENDLRNPKQETIRRIADALNCDFFWLLLGESLSIEERSALSAMIVFNTDNPYIKKAAMHAVYRSEGEHIRQGYSFSETEIELIRKFGMLNEAGQQKAIERVEELTGIPKYRKEDPNHDK